MMLMTASLVAGDSISFTAPSKGTLWKAGGDGVIQWQGSNDLSKDSRSLRLELVWGDPNAFISLGVIKSVKVGEGTYRYKVYDQLPSSDQYAVRANRTIYSDVFTITNDDPKFANVNPASVRLPDVKDDKPSSSTLNNKLSSWSLVLLTAGVTAPILLI